jgi:hypothetical protein
MDRKIFFCKSWFAAKHIPTEIWTESQARAAHESASPYTVLIDSIEKPFCVIDVTRDFVGVDFLDEHLREALTYHFQETSPGKLFLTMAVHREFESTADKVTNGTSYLFAEDGALQIRRESFVPSHKLETAKSQADVSGNYVPAPQFGEYDEFIRAER